MSKATADQALKNMLGAITDALVEEDKVTLIGFGTFFVTKPAREGHHPQTGKTMQIPARNVVKFKAGKKLVDSELILMEFLLYFIIKIEQKKAREKEKYEDTKKGFIPLLPG